MSESVPPLPKAPVVPRVFPTTGFQTIPTSEKVDEECWPWYTPNSFYPVRVGDIIHTKYQVLYKVGYGTTSTIWICRDLHHDDYVCMKSMVCDYPSVRRELKAYEILSKHSNTSNLYGVHFVRRAWDQFQLEIHGRDYPFLIHQPLGVTVELFADACGGRLPISYVQGLAQKMLKALEFIHSAQIVHGDLQAKNILLRIDDESVLQDGEENEINSPSRRKVTEQSAVFETRDYPGPLTRWLGAKSIPILCDFGEARTGAVSYTELIQPAIFRAPEVFLRLPWSEPVDIWNFGCMIWGLIFPTDLFSRRDKSKEDEQMDEHTPDRNQLARMAALLGLPPQQLLDDSGPHAAQFFYEDRSPKGNVPDMTLESLLASCLEEIGQTMATKESQMFLAFIRRTVTWTQDTRASASELLSDPWILRSESEE